MSREANQRLVDEAYAHVNSVGKPSVDKRGRCVYGGIGCAFSPAVLKEHRDHLAVKLDAKDLIFHHQDKLQYWARECDPSFANDVQSCHDVYSECKDFLTNFNFELKGLCNKHNYKFPGDKNA